MFDLCMEAHELRQRFQTLSKSCFVASSVFFFLFSFFGQVLRSEPQLVALAVDAFYTRDVDAMKAAAKMTFFCAPSPRPSPASEGGSSSAEYRCEKEEASEKGKEDEEDEDGLKGGLGERGVVESLDPDSGFKKDEVNPESTQSQPRSHPQSQLQMVEVMVRTSRAMYAQLKQQSFQAPKGYPMPLPSDANSMAADLGMKVACGFEMVYEDRREFMGDGEGEGEEDGEGEGGGGVEDDVSNVRAPSGDAGWERFRKSLEGSGYFRGVVEGSKQHRGLMRNAVRGYRQTRTFARIR